jgi:hypothetical protein
VAGFATALQRRTANFVRFDFGLDRQVIIATADAGRPAAVVEDPAGTLRELFDGLPPDRLRVFTSQSWRKRPARQPAGERRWEPVATVPVRLEALAKQVLFVWGVLLSLPASDEGFEYGLTFFVPRHLLGDFYQFLGALGAVFRSVPGSGG